MVLVFVSLAWLGGLYLGLTAAGAIHLAPGNLEPGPLDATQPWLAVMASLATLSVALAWGDRRLRILAVSLLFALLGVWRALALAPAVDTLPPGSDVVTLTGTVSSRPEPRDTAQLVVLEVDGLRTAGGWEDASARVLVRADRYQDWAYGDRVVARGELRPVDPSSGYWVEYLARQGIFRTLEYPRMALVDGQDGLDPRRVIDEVRDRLDAVAAELLPEPQASLLGGILVGSRSSMPPDFREALNVTSTSHIVAVSGFNVTVLAGVVQLAALRLLSRRRATILAIVAVWVYAILTGLPPSATRAAIMATMALGAVLAGRGGDAASFLCFSASLMAGLDPLLLYDLGFQLSFLATAGLVLLEPVLRGWMSRLPGWLSGSLSVTLAAQLAVLPVLLWSFRTISVVSPLSNLLISPALPVLMGFGSATVLLGAVSQPLGELVAPVTWLLLTYLVESIRWTARIPGASLETGSPTPGLVLLYYLLLVALATWPLPETRGARHAVGSLLARSPRWAPAGAAAALILLMGLGLSARPDGRLHVYFLDVGSGDATLIRGPQGHQILVDGGPSPSGIANALGRHIPFQDRRLDALVLTGFEEDRLAGALEVARRHPVDLVIQPGSPPDDPPGRAWIELLRERGIPVLQGTPGQRIALGEGSWLEVLWGPAASPPGEQPDAALALRLVHGGTAIVMLGDLSRVTQAQVARALPGRADLLRAPGHGASGSLDERFLKALSPQVTVLSVRAQNPYGQLAPSTLEALGRAALFRTEEHGTVEVVADRRDYKIFTER